MKDILKKDWPFIILLFVLTGITYLYFSLLNNGFCTAWDESYFLLKLQEAYDNSVITGKSQWNLLAIHWFPYLELTNPIHSRIAIWICLFCGSLITSLSLCMLYEWRKFLPFFTISYLLFLMVPTTYAGESLNYVPMQSLLISSSLCFCILAIKKTNKALNIIFSFFAGMSIGQALFVIMPSSALVLFCILILLLSQRKSSCAAWVGLGVIISILYVHFCVCSLPDILDAMKFTASYISKSGYGYTPTKFIISILMFFKDWGIVIFVLLGAYYVSSLFRNQFISILILVSSILIIYFYQRNPQIMPCEVLSLLLIIPLFDYYRKNTFCWHDYCQYLYYLFLFFIPVIATIGTNTYYGSRMICFIVPWLFLFFELVQTKKLSFITPILVLVVFGVFVLLDQIVPSYVNRVTQREEMVHFVNGNKHFAQMEITKDQKNYLIRVDSILNNYNYQPKQSIIFTSEYDYATVYAIDAKLSSNFYQKNNFLYAPMDKLIEPDFIFMCQWDIDVIGTHLQEMPWGWPDEFDMYYVGTPEGKDFQWDSNRWLYCKRSLKK